ncbi:MAG: AI-2E family transporter [Fusicatenibacter sp.]|nr:AI-2E family transporter [Lachnospiraceae bacterium]MDY2937916.1 AI-2E family transporter [Fusicatenibacter sp.]
MKLDKKTMHSIEFLIVFAVTAVVIGVRIEAVWTGILKIFRLLMPFLLGAALAFVINVMMSSLERHIFMNKYAKENQILQKIKRPVSLILAIFIWIAILVLIVSFLIPQLGDATGKLIHNIQVEIPLLEAYLREDLLRDNPQMWEKIQPFFEMQPDWEQLMNTAVNFLKNGYSEMMSQTVNAVTSIAGTVINTVTEVAIGLVFACYLLISKEKYGRQAKRLISAFLPKSVVDRILEIASLMFTTFSRFITGQCVEACILGSIFFVVLGIGGFPYAPLISVVIAFTALIPVFGAFIGCVLGVFLILTESPLKALIFIAVFLVIQQIEGNLIYPRVVGGSIGLPGIWTLAAVTVGGSLFGIVGMLVFIPLTSVLYHLLRDEVNRRLANKNTKENRKKETIDCPADGHEKKMAVQSRSGKKRRSERTEIIEQHSQNTSDAK